MHYVGTSTYQFIPYYAAGNMCTIHKHTHTPILKPSEDSEPTGLKVDIAELRTCVNMQLIAVQERQQEHSLSKGKFNTTERGHLMAG